jgi:H+-translocating NAD(P) transhydrogenase subunit alpha
VGVGVAGLAAISAAKSLGAIVRAFDTRLETKEQVESLGGEFLVLSFSEEGGDSSGYAKVMSPEFIEKEMTMFREQAKEVDIIITTAAIPGMRAPILIKEEAVNELKMKRTFTMVSQLSAVIWEIKRWLGRRRRCIATTL